MTTDGLHRLARRRPPLPIAAALVIYVIVNVYLSVLTVDANFLRHDPADWAVFQQLQPRLASGRLYELEPGYFYIWTPLAAVILSVIATIGFPIWAALHFLALGFLRDRLLIALSAVSWGFWTDVSAGNIFTFVFVAAVAAIRGSAVGSFAYLALFALAPRPVQVPLAAWIVLRRADLRVPAAALFAGAFAANLATGEMQRWVAVAGATPLSQFGFQYNLGLTRLLGIAGIAVGIPLGILLCRRGFLGLGGVAMSPYVLPQYWLMPLVDMARRRP